LASLTQFPRFFFTDLNVFAAQLSSSTGAGAVGDGVAGAGASVGDGLEAPGQEIGDPSTGAGDPSKRGVGVSPVASIRESIPACPISVFGTSSTAGEEVGDPVVTTSATTAGNPGGGCNLSAGVTGWDVGESVAIAAVVDVGVSASGRPAEEATDI